MCKVYTSVSEVMYTMYTRYTTFSRTLSKNLISIKKLSKNSHYHYCIMSIYKFSRLDRVYIYLSKFFKKVISKVSTLHTPDTYESFCYRQIRISEPYPALNLYKNRCVYVIHGIHKWMYDDYRLWGVFQFGLPFISVNRRDLRQFTHPIRIGEDYVL